MRYYNIQFIRAQWVRRHFNSTVHMQRDIFIPANLSSYVVNEALLVESLKWVDSVSVEEAARRGKGIGRIAALPIGWEEGYTTCMTN